MDDNRFCVGCGADTYERTSPNLSTPVTALRRPRIESVVTFVIAVTAMLVLQVLPQNPATASNLGVVPNAPEVSLSTILADYASGNELAADQKYKGQVIRTRGILKEVRTNLFGNPSAIVGLQLEFSLQNFIDLNCTLADAAVAEAASLKPGIEVVVQGQIRGRSSGVMAKDCIFLNLQTGDSSEMSELPEVVESADASESDESAKEAICASMYRNLTPSDMTPIAIAEFKQDCPGFDLPIQWQEAASAETAGQSDLLPASFDCRKAATSVEKVICGDPQISDLDGQLAKLYAAALRTGASQDAVRTAQRAWIKLRNGCADSSCVKAAYEERIAELR